MKMAFGTKFWHEYEYTQLWTIKPKSCNKLTIDVKIKKILVQEVNFGTKIAQKLAKC